MSKARRSSTYSTHTKLRLSWRLTEKELTKLSTFHTKSLRRILRTFWPKTISNKDLLERCGTESMATFLMRRRWTWISHVIRQEALHWRPEGSEGGVVRRSRGGGRWRRNCNRWERPKAAFQSWPRSGRSRGITLLPYTPAGVMSASRA